MNFCFVVPNYNHANTTEALLKRLESYNLACIMVDDGSEDAQSEALKKIAAKFPWVLLIRLNKNSGKGAAVQAGFRLAKEKGYTHALQVDADCQHDPRDIPLFIAASQKKPYALISGMPIFDESVPKERLYGRKITNFWVSIETWSCDIKEAMCGFRIYPLDSCLKIFDKISIAKRMDFDIDILVRLYWAGTETIFIPTKVIYPENGISHFNLLKDNLRISWTHTKLFFGMLKRIPLLIKKNQKKIKDEDNWFNLRELGTFLGLRCMLKCNKLLGRSFARILLYPLVIYFYLTNPRARRASKQYFKNLQLSTSVNQEQKKYWVFQHFFSFAESMLDKLSVWNDKIALSQLSFNNLDLLLRLIENKKGGVILTAHLGNIEIARSLARFYPGLKINALMFTENAANISRALELVNPEFSDSIIEVQKLDVQLAIFLKTKVDQGEFVVIAADRISITQPHRIIEADFLSQKASFPQGSFILAGLLQCPVYFMLCLKQAKEKYFFIIEEFADSIDVKKTNRQEQLSFYAKKYANLLEKYCRLYPLQWFNFFNFWQKSIKFSENSEQKKDE